MRKSKYDPLTIYLIDKSDDEITLTYNQIEEVLGFKLPPSAYLYTTLWIDGPSRPLPKSWIKAGYSIKNRLKDKVATFYKTRTPISTIIKKMNTQHRSTVFKSSVMSLDINDAIAAIRRFHNRNVDGVFTRYRSWAHCYKAFQEHWQDNERIDFLSLNLAWYLASWGMLRNSGLMNYDYKLHHNVIEKLTNNKFALLYEKPTEANIALVFEAASTIKDAYGSSYTPSNTAITKILLGVFGCAPAYDRFFMSAATKYNLCSRDFTKDSLMAIWDYYELHKDRFEELRNEFTLEGVKYTPMKLMDMAFFQLGKEDYDREEALKKSKRVEV